MAAFSVSMLDLSSLDVFVCQGLRFLLGGFGPAKICTPTLRHRLPKRCLCSLEWLAYVVLRAFVISASVLS